MNWFKNARTSTKLMVAFSLMAALLGVVGYEGISAASTLNRMLDTLYTRDMVGLKATDDAMLCMSECGRMVRQAILERDVSGVQVAEQAVSSSFSRLEEHLNRAEKTLATEEGRAILARVRRPLPE